MVHSRPAAVPEVDERDSELAEFVTTCERTTAQRDHEALGTSRAQYERYRQVLLSLGWAEWRSESDHRQGWELTAEPDDILEALE